MDYLLRSRFVMPTFPEIQEYVYQNCKFTLSYTGVKLCCERLRDNLTTNKESEKYILMIFNERYCFNNLVPLFALHTQDDYVKLAQYITYAFNAFNDEDF
jgi:hypothetical protein